MHPHWVICKTIGTGNNIKSLLNEIIEITNLKEENENSSLKILSSVSSLNEVSLDNYSLHHNKEYNCYKTPNKKTKLGIKPNILKFN